ncbi:MAG: RHS repeat-associated core domain-containing protein [Candidatus Acidiferrales bacterium]
MGDTHTSNACLGLSWTYDAWSNRTAQNVTSGTCNTFSATVNTKNQLVGPPYLYDAAGNLTADGNHTYTYDAENRLTAVDSGNTATYSYDALGRRVEKIVGTTRTDYVYDLSGNVVAEVNNVCASICWAVFYASMNGQLIAEYKNLTTYFFHGDHLGSSRLVTGVGQTQMPNGGFEQGLTDWWLWNSNSVLITDATGAHSGNNYVQLSAAAGGNAGVQALQAQELAVQPGDQLTFGGWSYLESGGTGALPGWWLQVEDANHNPLNWYFSGPVPTTSSGWTFQSSTYTVPSGVDYVALYATVWQPTVSTVLRVDDGFLYDGRTSPAVVQNLDYLPFGELNSTDSGITTHKFTGDERDAETSFDHTQFRQYTSQLARWITPDPAGLAAVDPANPQSWNRYAYVLNNPLNFIDPFGLGDCRADDKECPPVVEPVDTPICDWFCFTGGGPDPAPTGPPDSNIPPGCTLQENPIFPEQFDLVCPIQQSKNSSGPSAPGGNTSGTVRATPKLQFKPPSWHNFTHEFLPCYGSQLIGNLFTGDGLVGTGAAVALTVTKVTVGGPVLVVWTGINAFKAGAACAIASRGYYE